MWVAEKKERGRGVKTTVAPALWEKAPASAAIIVSPVKELMFQQARLEYWAGVERSVNELIDHPEVCEVDRLALAMERTVARCNQLACSNMITACEAAIQRHHEHLQQTCPHLL